MQYILSLYNYTNDILNKNILNEKTKILDPMNVIIKLAVLSYKSPNTKISISNHNITFVEPSYFQGLNRSYNRDNKEDIHYLLNPIYLAATTFLSDDNILLFQLARNGLLLLKDTYKSHQTINHTLDLYIYIIDNSIKKINIEYSFVKITEDDLKIYKKFLYKWSKDEISIILNLFNLINTTPYSSKIYYIESIEKVLIPIDKTIQEYSYII